MEAPRLRLVFGDRGILTKSQKKDGLKRSWILLKPHLDYISDVVSYLLHHFHPYDTCPNGIVLSMDGFILPPFESASILKDGDMIRVKKKGTGLRGFPKAIGGAKTFIEDIIVDKQPLPSRMELRANKEYDNEARGYESEADVDEGDAGKTISCVDNVSSGDLNPQKRKASNKNENSRLKRQCQRATDTVQKKHVHCEPITTAQEKRKLKNGSRQDSVCVDPEASRERTVAASGVPDGVKKVSRSTMRKRLQRRWRKEHGAKDKTDKQCEEQLPVKNLDADSRSKNDASANIIEHEKADEDSDAEGDLVPVVIKPGHIRFTPGNVNDVIDIQEANVWNGPSTRKSVEQGSASKKTGWNAHSTKKGAWKGESLRKNGSCVQKNQVAKETSQWNGITNRRRGQKWGTGKQPASSWRKSNTYKAHSSCSWATRKRVPNYLVVDFEKLVPLIDFPKAGDIVAYRLLELSSSSSSSPSLCPQLSSFRTGKISWFEPESNRIMLVPVPEYPFKLEKKRDDHHADASGLPPESSIYNEDGSLEIDFPSLVDVRIVKRGDLRQSVGNGASAANGTPASTGMSKRVNETQDGSKHVPSEVCNGELHTPAPVNGKKDVWEEISEVLSTKNKKAQLSQEDSWNKKASSSGRSWSQRTLTVTALSPGMAMPRAQNGT